MSRSLFFVGCLLLLHTWGCSARTFNVLGLYMDPLMSFTSSSFQFRTAVSYAMDAVRPSLANDTNISLAFADLDSSSRTFFTNIHEAANGFDGIIVTGGFPCQQYQRALLNVGLPTVSFIWCLQQATGPVSMVSPGFSYSDQGLATASFLLHNDWTSVIVVSAVESATSTLEFMRAIAQVTTSSGEYVEVLRTIVFDVSTNSLNNTLRSELRNFTKNPTEPFIFVLFAPRSYTPAVLEVAMQEQMMDTSHFWVVRITCCFCFVFL